MKQFKIKSIHLDTARTFIPIEELHRRVDELSTLGYTHLQLHFSDDQAWRFESKLYPRLHVIGSTRDTLILSNSKSEADDLPHFGFYTQDELKVLDSYAQSKNMSIIPAIDIPGHCSAAIVCYPELSSGLVFDKVPSLRGSILWKSKASTICYTNEFTKKWVKDIYNELMDVFPTSEYIHLGFDEIARGNCKCNKCDLGTLTELLKEVYDIVLNRGKKPIIWWAKEKNSFDFTKFPGLTLQYWGGSSLNKDTIVVTNDIIYSQYDVLYYDYPSSVGERLKILTDMGTVIVQPNALYKRIKNFPVNVVGVGACLWSENFYEESIRTNYMYPRLNKLSSILNGNNLGDFIQPMGSWVTSSFMSLLIKLIRSSGLAPIEIEDIKCNMDRSSMGDFLTYLNETHPEINFRSISLTKISNSVKNSLLRAGSDDIKIINKLYER